MWTLGIDVAKNRHAATLLDESGKRVFKNFKFANTHEGVDLLQNRLEEMQISKQNILIGMEATGHYWMVLYHFLCEAGFQVRVINPLMTAARRNVGIRGTKTDSADSELIARILREADPKFSAIPDDQTRQLRNLMRLRFECNQTLVAEKQRLSALMELVFPEYSRHFSDLFGAASLKVLSHFPTAKELAGVDLNKLTRLLEKSSKGRIGKQRAREIKNSAKNSFSLNQAVDSFAIEIRFIVERMNLLSAQIEELTRQAENHLAEQQELLKSIPGIGPVWAGTILAEVLPIFHPEEKTGARKLVAAAGLDVRLNESGQSTGKGKMSKRGSKYLRTAAIQAAEVAALIAKDPMFKGVYDKQRNKGKKHGVALSHTANKMLHVVFSVLKNHKPYELQLNH